MQKNILVVTPTLGNRPTLKRTVDSVREIGGNQVKHIIIAPSKEIPNLQKEYTDIECISEPDNCIGIYPALNHAFNQYGHNYEYLTFINDDDYWLSDYKILIDRITQNNLDFVYGKIRFVNEKEQRIRRMACSSNFREFIPLLYSNIILFSQQSTIISSKLFFDIGGFDEKYKLIADTKFWAQLSLKTIKYQYINKECAGYTIQRGQLSSNSILQDKEHTSLLNNLPTYSLWAIMYSKLKFRVINIHIYISRIINS